MKLILGLVTILTLSGCAAITEAIFGSFVKGTAEAIGDSLANNPPKPEDDVYEPIRTVKLSRTVQEQIFLDCKDREMKREIVTLNAPITRTKIVSKNNIPIERGVFTNTVNGDVAGSALFNTDPQWVGVTLDDGPLGTGLQVQRGDNLVNYRYETCAKWVTDPEGSRTCESWDLQEAGEVTVKALSRTQKVSICERQAKCFLGKVKGHHDCGKTSPSDELLENDW